MLPPSLRPFRLPLRRGLAVVLSGLLLAAAGCDSGKAPTAKQAPPTPLTRLNTRVMSIPRINFCELVPESAVDDALGVKKWMLHKSGNGDRASLKGPAVSPSPSPTGTSAPSTAPDPNTDVLAEHLCSWAPPDGGVQARAWTFAPPTDHKTARKAVSQASKEPGCRLVKGPQFGRPSLTQVCEEATGVRVRHAGLFKDTWLTCEVQDSEATVAEVRSRADAFCVEVVQTLNTTR